MDPSHERLARTGLAAAQRYGFALASGYAVQAAGLLERPSEDIDLFTGWNRRDEFGTAVGAVVQAYRDDGLTVDVERRYDTFARLAVSDGIFADALGRADLLDPDDFAQYGITGQALDDIRSRFAAWRRDLRDESSPESPRGGNRGVVRAREYVCTLAELPSARKVGQDRSRRSR